VVEDLPVQRKNTSEKSEGRVCKNLEARISEAHRDRRFGKDTRHQIVDFGENISRKWGIDRKSSKDPKVTS
jgi:hypothetical protein